MKPLIALRTAHAPITITVFGLAMSFTLHLGLAAGAAGAYVLIPDLYAVGNLTTIVTPLILLTLIVSAQNADRTRNNMISLFTKPGIVFMLLVQICIARAALYCWANGMKASEFAFLFAHYLLVVVFVSPTYEPIE